MHSRAISEELSDLSFYTFYLIFASAPSFAPYTFAPYTRLIVQALFSFASKRLLLLFVIDAQRALKMLQKISLFAKALVCILPMLWDQLRRGLLASWTRQRAAWLGSTPAVGRDHTNIVVGASFAGYTTARCLAFGLQPHSRHRIVVIEPSSHFQFSWVLPCYCVASGHEHKAFIPYGGYLRAAPEGSVRWVRDRVVDATKTCVKLGENGEIPYDYLVIATGSGGFYGLPSRVNQAVKSAGMERRLQAMQMRVKEANNIVIVGGGAAGVELAADAKDLYPKKVITLVHSRSALMHRFGKCLQDEALESLESLGVEVVLNDRVVHEDTDASTVRLESGRVICCDLSVRYKIRVLPFESTIC